MGWSCSTLASYRLQNWYDLCIKNSGNMNTWYKGNYKYFWEKSNREYSDGSITGTIYRIYTNSDDITYSDNVGGFKINGDGSINRAPKFLKSKCYCLFVDNICQGLWTELRNYPIPIVENLRKYIKEEYMKQFYKGGVNYIVTLEGKKIPYPTEAYIMDLDDKVKVVEWKSYIFECW